MAVSARSKAAIGLRKQKHRKIIQKWMVFSFLRTVNHGGTNYFSDDKNARSFKEHAMNELACETFTKLRVYFSEQRPLWDEEKWLSRYEEFMEELNSDFNQGLEDVKLHYFVYMRSEKRIMILYSADYDFFE